MEAFNLYTFNSQVTYADILLASIGSLAYAEDDGRHMLGIKTTRHGQVGNSSVGKGTDPVTTDASSSDATYCCYVLECDSEVITYDIIQLNTQLVANPYTLICC